MTLSVARTRAYLCAALTGAFAALGLAADRRRTAVLATLLSCFCGALAVALEERAQAGDADG